MIPKINCPYCGELLWDDNPIYQPTEGCFSICIFCGDISVFEKKLTLRKSSNDELDDDLIFRSRLIKEAIKRKIDISHIIKDAIKRVRKGAE